VFEIYDRLLQFTLFQGMSHADLMQVAGHTKFSFSKLAAGKRLAREGDACTQLHFVVSGMLRAETSCDDHSWRVVEQVSAPYTVQPERIFGISQRYTSSFTAKTPCSLISIDKQEVLLLLDTQLVFRLNMLNIMAAETHRLQHHAWRAAPRTLRDALVRFFFAHSLYPAGAKTFYILMNQLALILNDSRIDVSRVLNQLQDEQLLTLHRGRIEIPSLEHLLM